MRSKPIRKPECGAGCQRMTEGVTANDGWPRDADYGKWPEQPSSKKTKRTLPGPFLMLDVVRAPIDVSLDPGVRLLAGEANFAILRLLNFDECDGINRNSKPIALHIRNPQDRALALECLLERGHNRCGVFDLDFKFPGRLDSDPYRVFFHRSVPSLCTIVGTAMPVFRQLRNHKLGVFA